MSFFHVWIKEFWYSSFTKNVPRRSRSFDPKVQIFSIWNGWVIPFPKFIFLFLLGTMCLIRTASKKMFLIRTFHVKYIEKNYFPVNEGFPYLNLNFFFYFLYKKCSSIYDTWTSSGSIQTSFSYGICNNLDVNIQ